MRARFANGAVADGSLLIAADGIHSVVRAGLYPGADPPPARIVLANRGNGPEQVMQRVQQRAPNGFDRIEDVLTVAELAGTAAACKHIAGFGKDALNQRAAIVPV